MTSMGDISFEQFRDDFLKLVSEAQHIAITSHLSPDDDSIASVLSMRLLLIQRFPEKNIRIIYSGEAPSRYRVFEDFEKITWVSDVSEHLDKIDLLIMLDASQHARFSKNPEALKNVPTTVAIDHHASTPDKFSLLLCRSDFSSNAELVYRTFAAEEAISKQLAELFLLGILGDTGNLAYVKPSQAEVLTVVKKLVEIAGVAIDEFRSRYGGMPKRTFALIQVLMKNTSYNTMPDWPDFQYAYIDRAVLEAEGYTDEEMSAASHLYLSSYLPRITGYTWGFVITPRTDGSCRMSSRSQAKSVNVRDFHERLAIGGGHNQASGGYFPESEPSVCVARVLEWMKTNNPVILQ